MTVSMRRVAARVALMALGVAACAAPGRAQVLLSGGAACNAAADEAERDGGIPAGLLRAIGIVESGRWQGGLGRVAPWPFAIDAGGYSLFMESLPEAVEKVRALRQQGLESIDVGCFQINLMFHPAAFATVEEAFDPRANAAYAARFLSSLYARSGNWAAAVAAYHSGVPAVGEPYRARVYAAWGGTSLGGGAGAQGVADGVVSATVVSANVVLANLMPARGGVTPSVVRVMSLGSPIFARAAASIRVFVPAGRQVPAVETPPHPGARLSLRAVKRGLPAVFTPTSRL